ncbi:MAG TPA: nitroreductase family protein [Pseudonocardiaceae bacterium]
MGGTGAESAAQLLHRLTSYCPDREWDVPVDDPRVLQDFVPEDVGRHAPFVKRYASVLARTPLPRDLPVSRVPALAVLAGSAELPETPVDLAGLSRLLHLTAGVMRTSQHKVGTHLFRAAGSAGARFPLEFYVAVPQGSGLPPGVHWYDPMAHALVLVGPPPLPVGPEPGAPTVVVTGVPWRTGWKYAERGFRHIYWDAGTALSQLLALADSAGYAPSLYSRFPDAAVSELVGADGTHEWPVALVTLGDGAPSIAATAPGTAGSIDDDPLEFPLVTAAQHGGDLDHLGSAWATATAIEVPTGPATSLDEVIAKRGSQRRMDPERGLPADTLRACLDVALRGIDIEHWVAVNAVTGLDSGIYRWPKLDEPVRPVGSESMRAELYHACLDQGLGRDAAFVVIAATDVSRLSDREYREAQLAAGIVEGRVHLAAYALGASACGMTFLDSEIPALLGGSEPGADVEGLGGLLFTCVGVPANSSKPGGGPGAPTEVRTPSPRD